MRDRSPLGHVPTVSRRPYLRQGSPSSCLALRLRTPLCHDQPWPSRTHPSVPPSTTSPSPPTPGTGPPSRVASYRLRTVSPSTPHAMTASPPHSTPRAIWSALPTTADTVSRSPTCPVRSEEHTSELPSL